MLWNLHPCMCPRPALRCVWVGRRGFTFSLCQENQEESQQEVEICKENGTWSVANTHVIFLWFFFKHLGPPLSTLKLWDQQLTLLWGIISYINRALAQGIWAIRLLPLLYRSGVTRHQLEKSSSLTQRIWSCPIWKIGAHPGRLNSRADSALTLFQDVLS